MDPDSGFNSSDGLSDEEWDRSRFKRKSNIGKRAIKELTEHQEEDRAQSKRNARKLTVDHGAPGTVQAMQRLEATCDTFYTGLGKK